MLRIISILICSVSMVFSIQAQNFQSSIQATGNPTSPRATGPLTIVQASNGTNGAPSQVFTDFAGSADAAEDFVLPLDCPGGTRTIVSIDVQGANNGPFAPVAAVLNVYQDAGGTVGALISSETFAAPAAPNFTMTPVATPALTAGTYWFSILVDMPFATPNNQQWFWLSSLDEVGIAPYQWQDTNGLFGNAACATWGDGAAVCGVGDPNEPNLNFVMNLSEEDCPCVAEGGTLSGGPFQFCVGDGVPDNILDGDLILEGNDLENGANGFILTDELGFILDVVFGGLDNVDFDSFEFGTCNIWNINFIDGTIQGLGPGSNISEVTGCFDLSNPIAVDRIECVVMDPAIPTMGEWGLISLGILFMIFGIVSVRQRETAFQS